MEGAAVRCAVGDVLAHEDCCPTAAQPCLMGTSPILAISSTDWMRCGDGLIGQRSGVPPLPSRSCLWLMLCSVLPGWWGFCTSCSILLLKQLYKSLDYISYVVC